MQGRDSIRQYKKAFSYFLKVERCYGDFVINWLTNGIEKTENKSIIFRRDIGDYENFIEEACCERPTQIIARAFLWNKWLKGNSQYFSILHRRWFDFYYKKLVNSKYFSYLCKN